MDNENQQKGKGALDAFLNLLSLITVGWMSISIGIILFQIINKFLSDRPVDYVSRFFQGPLKFGIASAVILTPIFLAVSGWLHRHYKTGSLSHQSGIHRWLTYLMLLISALTVIGRLIYQLFRFLDGDYALTVILKTLVIFVIAGGIFGYYLYDLMRKDFSQRSKVSLVAVILVLGLVLASVIGGLLIIDSPAKARMYKFDDQRVDDLSQLSSMILAEYSANKILPVDLTNIKFAQITDPETKKPYDYQVLGDAQYQLCATFSLVAGTQNENYPYPYYGAEEWRYHQAGYQCFTVNINLDSIKANLAPLQ